MKSVSRLAVIDLQTDEMKFSSGHFMFFSATERETMHGHDYGVAVTLYTQIKHNGMSFDMRDYKQTIVDFCKRLDYRFIIPAQSDFLRLEETKEQLIVHFGQEKIAFLHKDAVLLPICNVTLEELSNWFLQEFTKNHDKLQTDNIQGMTVKIYNGRGESGSTHWGKLA